MNKLSTTVCDEVDRLIDEQTDNRAQLTRRAVRAYLNVGENGKPQKRYAHEPDVTIELTGFEARFLGNRLWELAEYDHQTPQMEGDIKFMARQIHTQVAETRSKNE